MVNLNFIKMVLFILTCFLFGALNVVPCTAQNFSNGVVTIKAVDAPALHLQNYQLGIGSEIRYGQGMIIDSAGIIATNKHIIGNAQHIYVALASGKTFEAALLHNSQADLCLIKINAPYSLNAVSLANSSTIQIGSNIIAVVKNGLNAQRIKEGQILMVFKKISCNIVELLELNITTTPGDSGSPILNAQGALLGLVLGKQISDPTKSYAIASSRIQQEYSLYRNSS